MIFHDFIHRQGNLCEDSRWTLDIRAAIVIDELLQGFVLVGYRGGLKHLLGTIE